MNIGKKYYSDTVNYVACRIKMQNFCESELFFAFFYDERNSG